jgi:hypothetical protein
VPALQGQGSEIHGEEETRMIRYRLATATIAIAIVGGTAVAQAPGERVFSFHSNATFSGCPNLDWHIVVAPDNSVTGLVGWQNMQVVARVTGTLNRQAKTFQLTAKEVGGDRTATIDGNVISADHIVANIKGPGVECQKLDVWGWTPSKKGPGGGRG